MRKLIWIAFIISGAFVVHEMFGHEALVGAALVIIIYLTTAIYRTIKNRRGNSFDTR